MRLFLSSYRAGKYPGVLSRLFRNATKVAVITNAKDYKTNKERRESVDEVLKFFESLNFEPVEIDLRMYFGSLEKLEKVLSQFTNIWVAGGNTFVLRKALNYSGADKYLISKVKDNKIAYGGESAGAILATPDFTGVEFGDDPNVVPNHYQKSIIHKGLKLIDYYIVPHYQSEWTGAEDMIKALERKNLKYQRLTDDQAILIDGDKEEFLK
jgi:dipeptidase E